MKTRIQDLRKELGVTQSELADAVDVTRRLYPWREADTKLL